MTQIGGCSSCAGPQGQLQELLNSYRQKDVPGARPAGGPDAAQDPSPAQRPDAVASAAKTDTRQSASPGDIQSVFRRLGEGVRSALIGAQSKAQDDAPLTGLDADLDIDGDGKVSLAERFGLAEAPTDGPTGTRLLTEAIVDHQRAAQSYYASFTDPLANRGLGIVA